MRYGGVKDGGTVASVQEPLVHIHQPDQQCVRCERIGSDPLRPVERPRRPVRHRRPCLGSLGLRLAPGGRGGLLQPLRQAVESRHPEPTIDGHLPQQHLPVEGVALTAAARPASHPASQHVDLTARLERVEAVLGQPANHQQAS